TAEVPSPLAIEENHSQQSATVIATESKGCKVPLSMGFRSVDRRLGAASGAEGYRVESCRGYSRNSLPTQTTPSGPAKTERGLRPESESLCSGPATIRATTSPVNFFRNSPTPPFRPRVYKNICMG